MNINGFVFNTNSELIEQPNEFKWFDLRDTYTTLIFKKDYIKASRINHLNNCFYPEVITPLYNSETK